MSKLKDDQQEPNPTSTEDFQIKHRNYYQNRAKQPVVVVDTGHGGGISRHCRHGLTWLTLTVTEQLWPVVTPGTVQCREAANYRKETCRVKSVPSIISWQLLTGQGTPALLLRNPKWISCFIGDINNFPRVFLITRETLLWRNIISGHIYTL